jgi:hypothetical protein
VEAINDGYTEMMSMYAMANIYNSKDSSSALWSEEYAYISGNLPTFNETLEKLFVAAAQSPHAERFEEEYFGEGLIEEYADGGDYTDRIVELMEEEARLESQYSAISTATVKITYNGTEDTVDNILANLKKLYGDGSTEYFKKQTTVMALYEAAVLAEEKPIYRQLVATRIRIADEFGYDSYAEYAYEVMGHDYTVADTLKLFSDIREYVYPVYNTLYDNVFKSYFSTNKMAEVDRVTLINTLYKLYSELDEDLSAAYSYMLQHGLYDVEQSKTNRFEGAFTAYVEGNNSPFIFMSTGGYINDHITLAHEFGHFYDGFVNYGADASLDISEISSQGLELLSMLYLDGYVTEESHQYLEYYELFFGMDSMLFQGLIACFEHYAYGLNADAVTDDALDGCMIAACHTIFGEAIFTNYNKAIMVHTVEYPFYVQSYCTSLTATLEIFFAEAQRSGDGMAIYKKLIDRGEDERSYEEILTDAGLSSPFEEDLLKVLSDKLYYYVTGKHYFEENAA